MTISRRMLNNGILNIAFNRPKANALNRQALNDFKQAMVEASCTKSVRGVLLTGQPAPADSSEAIRASTSAELESPSKIFGAGLDLAEMGKFAEDKDRKWLEDALFNRLGGGLHAMISSPKPIASAVYGHAIAGGLVYPLAGDYIAFGNPKGGKPFKAGLTEHKVGVPFPPLVLDIVRNQMPPRAFRDLVYTARLAPLNELYDLGVGDALVEGEAECMAKAMEWLELQSSYSCDTVAYGKRSIWKNVVEDGTWALESTGADHRQEYLDVMLDSEENREVLMAALSANTSKK